MQTVADVPVTVKCRLGVDEQDSYDCFSDFLHTVAESGCHVFVVHARKAWLSGLSPKENRDIPELRYEWVYRIKQEQPNWTILLNGGVTEVDEIREHLQHVDGVMLGRVAYQNPWILTACQAILDPEYSSPQRSEVVQKMVEYARKQTGLGIPVKHISRHMLGLFQGLPGAKRWKRWISENAHKQDADYRLLAKALEHFELVQLERDAA
jgi:tRNA-dihydrouridine synthase A